MIPPRVEASANAAGFGPLVARCPHPNRRVNAFAYWAWAAMLAMIPLAFVVLAIVGRLAAEGETPQWAAIVLYLAVAIGLGAFLAVRGAGWMTRHAFYLYPQGYVVMTAAGRVIRVRWEDVGRIDRLMFQVRMVIPLVSSKPRVRYKIHHAFDQPRPIAFVELADRAVLGPLVCELHTAATQKRH
jgi:hypothetical protein